MTSPPDYDVIIAGGGMVGTSLAIGLASKNLRIAVVESVTPELDTQPSFDDRGLALSLSSQRIFSSLGVWQALAETVTPVRQVHVSDLGHFGFVRLKASDMHIPALGYVVLARALGKVLCQQVKVNEKIDLISPAVVEKVTVNPDSVAVDTRQDNERKILHSKLLVAADGSHSNIRSDLGITVRHRDYQQVAFVSNAVFSGEHQNIAYERFTPAGPGALLPLDQNRYAVVFTVKNSSAAEIAAMSDADFMQQLQQRFGKRTGKILKVGKRKSYPLEMLHANEQVRERVVILGNAAHTLHPNGAQGFNLCLRDVAGLLDTLAPAIQQGEDIGRPELLNEYYQSRLSDQKQVERFSDGVASVFYNNLPHKVFIRNSAMLFLDLCPPAKRIFMKQLMGLRGRQPAMVCDAVN